MKSRVAAKLAGCVALALMPITSPAQQSVPSNPRVGKGSTSTGSNTGAAVVSPDAPVIVTITAVSPERVFTNREGKDIRARLIAYSAPENPGDGPVEVIREGKVLLLVAPSRKPVEYPLENLSDPDQDFVRQIAKAASGSGE